MLKLKTRRRRKPARARQARSPRLIQQILGWCVHAYTALGLVAAALIAVLIIHGGPDAFRSCFLLMAAATIIDSTDGILARKVRIKEAVPGFDGRRLDDIVDFLNYTTLRLLLVWRARILPAGQDAWLLLPLLASAYGFCQVQAKTDDGYFLGFPSLWNVVAFYLYALPMGAWPSLLLVVVLAGLTFVPVRHLYPSQPGRLNRLATILGSIWAILVSILVWNLPRSSAPRFSEPWQSLAYLSLFYPIFYLASAWAISLYHLKKRVRGEIASAQTNAGDQPHPQV
jgi:phosphatidylcholine synthase